MTRRSISYNAPRLDGGKKQWDYSENSYMCDPIFDELGNIIYEPKHRKPKWVLKSEHLRFQKYEDPNLTISNSRNNRIRMEDPFIRRTDDKYVFTHITDNEIAKYMIAVGYLEKDFL